MLELNKGNDLPVIVTIMHSDMKEILTQGIQSQLQCQQ